MEAGRECFVVQEPGLAGAEEFQTLSISTHGLPARSATELRVP